MRREEYGRSIIYAESIYTFSWWLKNRGNTRAPCRIMADSWCSGLNEFKLHENQRMSLVLFIWGSERVEPCTPTKCAFIGSLGFPCCGCGCMCVGQGKIISFCNALMHRLVGNGNAKYVFFVFQNCFEGLWSFWCTVFSDARVKIIWGLNYTEQWRSSVATSEKRFCTLLYCSWFQRDTVRFAEVTWRLDSG